MFAPQKAPEVTGESRLRDPQKVSKVVGESRLSVPENACRYTVMVNPKLTPQSKGNNMNLSIVQESTHKGAIPTNHSSWSFETPAGNHNDDPHRKNTVPQRRVVY